MSEQTAEGTAEQSTEQTAGQPPEGEQESKTFDAEYVANLRKEAAKYRTDARTATAELEKQRNASMSESERAVSEARAQGRLEAVSEYGKELVQTQFDAAAGRRNPEFDTAKALAFLDLSKFLGEDGRPDLKAISEAVDIYVPSPGNGEPIPPSFDGGTRTTAPGQSNMNSLLRKAAGRA